MVNIPPYLRNGNSIGLICPAGYMPAEKISDCVYTLSEWGYKVVKGKTLGNQFHYFSGSDEERLNDFQSMLDNPDIKAILCARGGYGTSRIMDRINWKKFKKKPKWVIGFSDITAIQMHLFTTLKTASLHAPMAGAFQTRQINSYFTDTLKFALAGKQLKYSCESNPFNRTGKATGTLIGGNLSLLVHLLGTKSFPQTKGVILFLEDIGEYLYQIDRMLLQLNRANKLKDVSGIIIGGFSDMKDTLIPFGQSLNEIIFNQIKHLNVPIAFGFPVSHEEENVSLRVGMIHTLEVQNKKTTLISEPYH